MSSLELITELRQTIKDERYARQCDHKMVDIKIAELEEQLKDANGTIRCLHDTIQSLGG